MSEEFQEKLRELARRLDLEFTDPKLLEDALTHSSFLHEAPDSLRPGDYERLEFLGDAVLSLAMSHILMERDEELPVGELSKIRAAAVNRTSLARLARRLELGDYIRLSRGEELTAGREKSGILADVFESVIGAVYLDQGFEKALDFVQRQFRDMFQAQERILVYDYKTRLQEWTQARFGGAPQYRTVSARGPAHDKLFKAELSVAGQVRGCGSGKSKKEAEQAAARDAFIQMTGSDPAGNHSFLPRKTEKDGE